MIRSTVDIIRQDDYKHHQFTLPRVVKSWAGLTSSPLPFPICHVSSPLFKQVYDHKSNTPKKWRIIEKPQTPTSHHRILSSDRWLQLLRRKTLSLRILPPITSSSTAVSCHTLSRRRAVFIQSGQSRVRPANTPPGAVVRTAEVVLGVIAAQLLNLRERAVATLTRTTAPIIKSHWIWSLQLADVAKP